METEGSGEEHGALNWGTPRVCKAPGSSAAEGPE